MAGKSCYNNNNNNICYPMHAKKAKTWGKYLHKLQRKNVLHEYGSGSKEVGTEMAGRSAVVLRYRRSCHSFGFLFCKINEFSGETILGPIRKTFSISNSSVLKPLIEKSLVIFDISTMASFGFRLRDFLKFLKFLLHIFLFGQFLSHLYLSHLCGLCSLTSQEALRRKAQSLVILQYG